MCSVLNVIYNDIVDTGFTESLLRESVHPPGKSLFPVSLEHEAAGHDQRIHLFQHPVPQSADTPKLGRAAVGRETAETGFSLTDLFIILPEIMGRTEEPVGVLGEEFDPGPHAKRPDATEE